MEESYPDRGADDMHQSSPYTDGETRMVLVKDGEKDCWAMLLSLEMVDHINFAKQQSRAIAKREPAIDQAATEVLTLGVSIEDAEDIHNQIGGQEKEYSQLKIDGLQVKLRQAIDRRDVLQEDIEPYQPGLECSKNITQRTVEDALEEVGLLDPPEPDSPSKSRAEDMDEAAQSYQGSEPSKDDESVSMTEVPNEEDLLRRAACDELARSRQAQMDAQIAFDGKKEEYTQELMEFERVTADGKMDYTRSEFDVEHGVKRTQQLTRNLREADERLMRAQLNCQAFGIRTDPDVSYSDFSDYMDLGGYGDNGFGIGEDSSPNALVKRGGVEAWTQGVWENQDPDIAETYDPVSFDEWDSRPDDPMDSISVLDCDRWVGVISRWQEHCLRLRNAESKGPLQEDVWTIQKGGDHRRRSI